MVVELPTLLDRSIDRMGNGMNEIVKETALEVIRRAYAEGIYVQLSDGFRSIVEQNALYMKGRRGIKGEAKVTYAKGGTSYHNYGLAVDFFLVSDDGNTALWTVNGDWKRVAAIAKSLGFEWGGDWTSFKDNPHLQMAGGLSINQLQAGQRPSLVSKLGMDIQKPIQQTGAIITSDIKVGSYVTVLSHATHYATGEPIADFVRGQKYKVIAVRIQTQSNSTKSYLLDGIMSWVLEQDVTGSQANTSSGKATGKLTYTRTLKKGMQGDDVKALQNALNKVKFKVGTADGFFGAKTEDAVRRFQSVYLPYEVDGLAGRKTINELNKKL